MGLAAYAFQIYFDFSGYSDMAIGLGRMFGFHGLVADDGARDELGKQGHVGAEGNGIFLHRRLPDLL